MTTPVGITPLSASAAAALAPRLVALDDSVRAELGAAYSHERWTDAHFLQSRPSKWVLSHVAGGPDDMAGFWIASAHGGDAHTHRVAVTRPARQSGAGGLLFRHVQSAARREGLRRMTLTLAAGNVQAQRFYQRHGFRRLTGADLGAFLEAHGLTAGRDDDQIAVSVDDKTHLYFAMFLPLED